MVLDRVVYKILQKLEPKSNKTISRYLIKPVINAIPYSIIGYFKTGKQQEKYAQQLGFSNLKLTNYSLMIGILSKIAELGIKTGAFYALTSYLGDGFENNLFKKITDNGINAWIIVKGSDLVARSFYSLITKKPIGSFFIEIPIYFKKKLFNHKEPLEEKLLEIPYKAQETSVPN